MKSLLNKLRSMGLATRVVTTVLAAIIVITGFTTYYVKTLSYNTAQTSISSYAVEVIQNMGKVFKSDTYDKFLVKSIRDENYWVVREQLNVFAQQTGALYAYVMDYRDGVLSTYIIGEPKDEDKYGPIGQPAEGNDVELAKRVYKGESVYSPIINDINYGSYVSAWTPVKNAKGEVIGILGFDIDVNLVSGISKDVYGQSLKTYLPLMLLVAIIVIGACAYVVARSLRPLNGIKRSMESLANNDLNKAAKDIEWVGLSRKDEVGQLQVSVSKMINNLQSMVLRISGSTQNTEDLSQELLTDVSKAKDSLDSMTKSLHNISEGSALQMNSATESSLAASEMASGITRIAQSSMLVSERSNEVLHEASDGYGKIQSVIKQVEVIQEAVTSSANTITEMSKRSHEIDDVLASITEVAVQTNLLSLNASIEAARAGEHGRGFSVVAAEIRKLAEHSQVSVNKISTLLAGIHGDTENAMYGMTKGVKEADAGIILVREAGAAFNGIVNKITSVAEEISEVSAAAEQISAGAEEVAATIEDMSNIAISSSELTTAVEKEANKQLAVIDLVVNSTDRLSNNVTELKTVVDEFSLKE